MRRVVWGRVRGGLRPDLPTGCREQLDAEYLSFLRFVWDFDRASRPAIETERLARGPSVPVVHLAERRQIAAFLRSLG